MYEIITYKNFMPIIDKKEKRKKKKEYQVCVWIIGGIGTNWSYSTWT